MESKLIYKCLCKNQSSERLWGLSEQPVDTCVVIDSEISDVESYLSVVESLGLVTPELGDLYRELILSLEEMRLWLVQTRLEVNRYKADLWAGVDKSVWVAGRTFKRVVSIEIPKCRASEDNVRVREVWAEIRALELSEGVDNIFTHLNFLLNKQALEQWRDQVFDLSVDQCVDGFTEMLVAKGFEEV